MSVRRVVKYEFPLPLRKKIEVRARSYRSTKAVSSGNTEFIIPTYLLLQPTKELSFKVVRRKKLWQSSKSQSFRLSRSLLSFTLISFGLFGIVFFSAEGKQSQSIQPQNTFSPPVITSQRDEKSQRSGLPRSAPKELKIKSISLDVPLMGVGRKPDKTMEVPPLFEHVAGWYKPGPAPGEIGPAVIVGHVDTYKGPSVFYGLKDLKAGNIIEIKRADKKIVKFKIVGLEQFDQNHFPTEKVYGNLDYAGLRLITCGGTFNQQTQRYSDNTVVFARMVT